MKRPGIIKKIMLSILGIFICLILLFYWMFGWLWVPRYRTRFNDSRDFAYKIPMSCHDTEYDYCIDIKYIYEKYGWSKIGGYVRYIDTQTHYNEEKIKYLESYSDTVEIYSIISDEHKEQYRCEDIFEYDIKIDNINYEYLNKYGIDSKLIDKILIDDNLNEYELLCGYMYDLDIGLPGMSSEENNYFVLCNDDSMSFLVLRLHKVVPD